MPTKRKGASKHRHSRRSRRHSRRHRHSRRSVRGGMFKWTTYKPSLSPSHESTPTPKDGVSFEFIGSPAKVKELNDTYKNRTRNEPYFKTYIGRIAPNGQYMPGGYVYWTRGDEDSKTPPGWYEVTSFNKFNEPMGEARGIIHNADGAWTYIRDATGEIVTYPIGIPSPAHATHPRPEPLMNGV